MIEARGRVRDDGPIFLRIFRQRTGLRLGTRCGNVAEMQSGELHVAVEESTYGPGLGDGRGTTTRSGREQGIVEGESDTNIDRSHLLRWRPADEKGAHRWD